VSKNTLDPGKVPELDVVQGEQFAALLRGSCLFLSQCARTSVRSVDADCGGRMVRSVELRHIAHSCARMRRQAHSPLAIPIVFMARRLAPLMHPVRV
jgi:hypothetical protein